MLQPYEFRDLAEFGGDCSREIVRGHVPEHCHINV